MEAMFFF